MSDLLAMAAPDSALPASVAPDSAPLASDDVAERVRLMRDALFNYSAVIANGLIGLLLVPVLLHGFGSELYGAWVAINGLAGMATLLDLGLGYALTREVAGASDDAVGFARSAAAAYLWLGAIGALAIVGFGLPFTAGLRLSGEAYALARMACLATAGGYAAQSVMFYNVGVLQGTRRFGIANLISVGGMVISVLGMVALLIAHRSIVALAVWNSAATWLTAGAGLWAIEQVAPRFRFRPGVPRWACLRRRMAFSLQSLFTMVLQSAVWQAPVLLIGLWAGAAAIVPFYLGLRFPLAVAGLTAAAAGTLFAASAACHDDVASQRLLDTGTRWLLILALPPCLALLTVSSTLLRVWVGAADPAAVAVLRLTTLAVLCDALGAGALYLLWGRARLRPALIGLGAALALALLLGAGLTLRFGVAGAAAAIAFYTATSSLILLLLALKECSANGARLVWEAGQGLWLPAAGCTIVLLAADQLLHPARWASFLAVCALSGCVYFGLLWLTGLRKEERAALKMAASATRQIKRLAPTSWKRGYHRAVLALRLIRQLDAKSPAALRQSLACALYCFRIGRDSLINPCWLVALHRLGRQVVQTGVPGDFVECGVYRGGSAAVLADALRDPGCARSLWLFDSFLGLPTPGPADGEEARLWAGKIVSEVADVQRVLGRMAVPLERVRIVPGWFHQTFPVAPVQQVALLHIDADWYDSISLCLRKFYDLLAPGAVVVLDDYFDWPGCRAALEDFCRERSLQLKLEGGGNAPVHFFKP